MANPETVEYRMYEGAYCHQCGHVIAENQKAFWIIDGKTKYGPLCSAHCADHVLALINEVFYR